MSRPALSWIVGCWVVLLGALISGTVFGPEPLRTWLRDYGILTSALLAAAITCVYVVITHEQLRSMRKMLQLQFGAGLTGPKVEIHQVDRESPPSFRIEEAYKYPAEYRGRALPHEKTEGPERQSRKIEKTVRYETIRVSNRSEQPIHKLSLRVRLIHDAVDREFSYEHPDRIEAKGSIDIGVWPVKSMPRYRLCVSGTYEDAIGERPLMACEETR